MQSNNCLNSVHFVFPQSKDMNVYINSDKSLEPKALIYVYVDMNPRPLTC